LLPRLLRVRCLTPPSSAFGDCFCHRPAAAGRSTFSSTRSSARRWKNIRLCGLLFSRPWELASCLASSQRNHDSLLLRARRRGRARPRRWLRPRCWRRSGRGSRSRSRRSRCRRCSCRCGSSCRRSRSRRCSRRSCCRCWRSCRGRRGTPTACGYVVHTQAWCQNGFIARERREHIQILLDAADCRQPVVAGHPVDHRQRIRAFGQ